MSDFVTPEQLAEQRAKGWPDFGPERYCQRCGRRNVRSWCVASDRFNMACEQGEIVCPSCFVLAHEQATGMSCSWELVPATPFRWISEWGRPTPFLHEMKDGQLVVAGELWEITNPVNKVRIEQHTWLRRVEPDDAS